MAVESTRYGVPSTMLVLAICCGCALTLLSSCGPEKSAPVALFEVSPNQGDSLTVFYFDARETFDPESPTFGITLRWDWNSDSIFDTDYLPDKEYVRRFNEPGWHYIIMEATDVDGMVSYHNDSILIFQGNGFVDSITDPRDGQVYSIARVNHQWLMTENLRYGQWIDTAQYPEYNDTPEFYSYLNDSENIDYGGLYNWDEAMNYVNKESSQGVCPPGWHIPSSTEWKNVLSVFPSSAADMFYYWGKGSPTGFNLELYGFYYYTLPPDSLFSWYPRNTVSYWTSDYLTHYLEDPDDFIHSLRFFPSQWEIRRHLYKFDDYFDKSHLLKFACYVRCFKDPEE